VPGLDRFPRDQWPNVRAVHWSFDVMVGSGMFLLALAVFTGFRFWRRGTISDSRWHLRAFVACAPLGFIALESGWFVTELGRQPWIIYGIMKTSDAVTPMPWLVVPFSTFTGVYLFLSVVLIFLLKRQFIESAPSPSEESHAA
jgi:cytochrome d ubiquinol oxidase subunit I